MRAGLADRIENAVAQKHGLLEIVRDEDDRALAMTPDVEHLALHALARRLVEADERLVHQDEVGVGGKGARDGDALLHAAGNLVRIVVLEARQPDDARRSRAPCASISAPATRP